MNPKSPHIRGLIKVHKSDTPIRPIVNWTNAPAYNLAKQLVQFLNTHLPLPCAYNIKNTIHLINDLGEIPWNNNPCIASFDISNMYTNIPTDQIPNIINILCNHYNIDPQLRSEIIRLCELVLSQNYFTFRSSTYQQNTGLAMGAPTSSIFSEIYLQYLEDTKFLDILTRHHILGYFRYADDILVVYNSSDADIHTVLDLFNDTSKALTFTMEMEKENNINFLDISILKNSESFEFKIHRKPTAADTIIPSDSNHPPEHKLSAIRYLINRLHSYPVTDAYKQVEHDTIRHVLYANKYRLSILSRIPLQIQTTVREKSIQSPELPQSAHGMSQNMIQQKHQKVSPRLHM